MQCFDRCLLWIVNRLVLSVRCGIEKENLASSDLTSMVVVGNVGTMFYYLWNSYLFKTSEMMVDFKSSCLVS